MPYINPTKPQPVRPSASTEDLDQHQNAANAAQAEIDRYDSMIKPSAAGAGRHQSQLDGSFYRPVKGRK